MVQTIVFAAITALVLCFMVSLAEDFLLPRHRRWIQAKARQHTKLDSEPHGPLS